MEGKKRTRSQTTLDKYIPVNFSQSPLKHARSALRHASPSTVNEPQPPDLPTDGKLKRPSSPANDPALLLERDPKRPRRDLFPLSAVRPTDDTPSVSSSPFRRAHSVPPISSTLPLLDLNNLPPSPRRSPAKFRIASVPPDPPPLHSLVLHPRPTPKPSISIVPHPPPSLSTPPSPLSPLSPLSPTDDERMPVDAAPVPTPSDLKPSRLPVPSVIAKMKPKLPTLTKKALSAHPTKQTSLAIRTTRSASLRQKKVQDEAKAKHPPTQGPSATPHRRRSMSLSSYAQPTAASAAKASPLKPASSAHPPSGPFTFTAAITPRLSHLVSAGSLNAVASSSKLPSESRVNASTTTLQLNSSLSTLNEALERLNAPPPSRPNTSMGFHRSAESDEDSDPERAALRSSTGASRRPASVLAGAPKPHSTAAKGKSRALAPATPAQTRTTETKARAALGRTQSQPQLQTQEKKMLRQTTLMLPPPLPAPGRVTQAQRDGGLGSVEEGERVDTAKAQASLALAPSLSKMRGSLGYALTPAGSASGCTPRLGVKVGAAPTTQTRIFPSSTQAGRSKQGQPAPAHRSSFEAALRGGPSAGAGMRGTGMRRTGALGSRVLQRVSKKSSLPVVIGSPVKGGVVHEDVIDAGEDEGAEESGERTTQERIGMWLKNASADVLRGLGHSEDAQEPQAHVLDGLPTSDVPGSSSDAQDIDLEREREKEYRKNASRRASMASQLLSQSLSALPDTPPDAHDKGKGKARAMSSSWPVPRDDAKGVGKGADGVVRAEDGGSAGEEQLPPPLRPTARPVTRQHNTRLATGALSTPPSRYAESGGTGGSGGKGKEREKVVESPGALAVLRGCTIFVDVRTEEGDDAGALFVDMLRGLGAKMASRVGSRCTHVVYKNGLMSTLTRYRLLKEPKPYVVGIAWVVECVEQRTRVDETRFLVNLDLANVAGVNKRRKSMLPKSFGTSPVSGAKTGGIVIGGLAAGVSPPSSDSSFRTVAANGSGRHARSRSVVGDWSVDVPSPTALPVDDDGDSSMQSNGAPPMLLHADAGAGARPDDDESLPPLEKARRRRSMLPAR